MNLDALFLEDDSQRMARFRAVLPLVNPKLKIIHWPSAHRMIRECPPYLSSCAIICLDHDLYPEAGGEDPGDGLDVARFLAPLKPSCPILIHSSNGDRVARMLGEFQLYDCRVATVLPLGGDWIEKYWREKAEKLLSGRTA